MFVISSLWNRWWFKGNGKIIFWQRKKIRNWVATTTFPDISRKSPKLKDLKKFSFPSRLVLKFISRTKFISKKNFCKTAIKHLFLNTLKLASFFCFSRCYCRRDCCCFSYPRHSYLRWVLMLNLLADTATAAITFFLVFFRCLPLFFGILYSHAND